MILLALIGIGLVLMGFSHFVGIAIIVGVILWKLLGWYTGT